MPSVASEINAAQQSRFHHSQARNRADGNDRSQSSPFADLLDSAAPATDPAPNPAPMPQTARADKTDKSNDSRPADKGRKTDAASDRSATSASDASDPSDTKGTKTADTKDAEPSDDGKATETGDNTTAPDADAATKTDGDLEAALQAAPVDPTQQPAVVDLAVTAAQTAVSDASQSDASGSNKAPQIDALAALQAAEQNAAAANAGTPDPAAKADDTKGKGQAADDKGDSTIKKDAKSDTKALVQAKSDAIADAKTAAAQPQTDADSDAGQQGGDKSAAASHQGVTKPTSDATEPETRGHRAAPVADAAKTAAVQAQNAQAATTVASADAAATATAVTGANTTHAPQAQTSTHIQAQLQLTADTAAVVQVSALPVEIATRAVAGKRQFEIRLDPPELGRVDVKVDIDKNGNATARLVVEKAETLDLLKRDSQQLERALQQAGLKTSDNGLEFSLRQQSAQGDDQGSSKATTLMVADEDAAPLPVQRQGYGRLLGMSGGLDIRV